MKLINADALKREIANVMPSRTEVFLVIDAMPDGIVRCKNCKHLIDHYGFMDDGYCRKMREEYCVKFKPDKNWFCADGRKRDDT